MKKGFTRIELLAVLVILGVISFIAVPNVVELINGNKKDTMLSDARKMEKLIPDCGLVEYAGASH